MTTTETGEFIAEKYEPKGPVVLDCHVNNIYYGDFRAVRDTSIPIEKNKVTGFIGPSGCGKSTVLRSMNRMNDLIDTFRFDGHIRYHQHDIYDKKSRSSSGASLHWYGVPIAESILDEHLR
jgi:phosphate transport system ATP-binding protein